MLKARVKATGEIIEVEDLGNEAFGRTDGPVEVIMKGMLDFNVSTPEKAVIEGWIARDRLNNGLFLHDEKPYRAFSGYQTDGKFDEWRSETCPPYPINSEAFSSITWQTEPKRVRIEITLIDDTVKAEQQ